jgi:hypothetical protein
MCYEYSSWFRSVRERELAKARERKEAEERAAAKTAPAREPARPQSREPDKVPA